MDGVPRRRRSMEGHSTPLAAHYGPRQGYADHQHDEGPMRVRWRENDHDRAWREQHQVDEYRDQRSGHPGYAAHGNGSTVDFFGTSMTYQRPSQHVRSRDEMEHIRYSLPAGMPPQLILEGRDARSAVTDYSPVTLTPSPSNSNYSYDNMTRKSSSSRFSFEQRLARLEKLAQEQAHDKMEKEPYKHEELEEEQEEDGDSEPKREQRELQRPQPILREAVSNHREIFEMSPSESFSVYESEDSSSCETSVSSLTDHHFPAYKPKPSKRDEAVQKGSILMFEPRRKSSKTKARSLQQKRSHTKRYSQKEKSSAPIDLFETISEEGSRSRSEHSKGHDQQQVSSNAEDQHTTTTTASSSQQRAGQAQKESRLAQNDNGVIPPFFNFFGTECSGHETGSAMNDNDFIAQDLEKQENASASRNEMDDRPNASFSDSPSSRPNANFSESPARTLSTGRRRSFSKVFARQDSGKSRQQQSVAGQQTERGDMNEAYHPSGLELPPKPIPTDEISAQDRLLDYSERYGDTNDSTGNDLRERRGPARLFCGLGKLEALRGNGTQSARSCFQRPVEAGWEDDAASTGSKNYRGEPESMSVNRSTNDHETMPFAEALGPVPPESSIIIPATLPRSKNQKQKLEFGETVENRQLAKGCSFSTPVSTSARAMSFPGPRSDGLAESPDIATTEHAQEEGRQPSVVSVDDLPESLKLDSDRLEDHNNSITKGSCLFPRIKPVEAQNLSRDAATTASFGTMETSSKAGVKEMEVTDQTKTLSQKTDDARPQRKNSRFFHIRKGGTRSSPQSAVEDDGDSGGRSDETGEVESFQMQSYHNEAEALSESSMSSEDYDRSHDKSVRSDKMSNGKPSGPVSILRGRSNSSSKSERHPPSLPSLGSGQSNARSVSFSLQRSKGSKTKKTAPREHDEATSSTGGSSASNRSGPSHLGWKYDRDHRNGRSSQLEKKESYMPSLFSWPGVDYAGSDSSGEDSVAIDIGDYSLHAF